MDRSPGDRRLAAISVDLDEIDCYAAIHGLRPPADGSAHAVYDRALPRLAELFARQGVPATFFVIGKDLARADNAREVARLAEDGHEIGSHSQSHFYDLTRRDRATVRSELELAAQAIARVTGARPEGFRAPGYTVSDALLELVAETGHAYDASVFPCPAYFGAKTLAIGAVRARGRRSRSIVDDPRVLLAPADPYRVGRPYWQRGGGLVELPIGVTREATGRLPYIGTSVVLGGPTGAQLLTRMIAGRPLVSLELHGIDLADAAQDGLGWLRPHQPDLRRPVKAKTAALSSAIEALRSHGYELVTLRQAARAFA